MKIKQATKVAYFNKSISMKGNHQTEKSLKSRIAENLKVNIDSSLERNEKAAQTKNARYWNKEENDLERIKVNKVHQITEWI